MPRFLDQPATGARPSRRALPLKNVFHLFRVSLWLFIFAIPIENTVAAQAITLSHVLGTVAALVGVVAITQRPTVKTLSTMHQLLLAFVLYSVMTLAWTPSLTDTLKVSATYIQLFVMAWLIWQSGHVMRQQNLLAAYVAGCAVAAGATVYSFCTGSAYMATRAIVNRYAAAGFDPNDSALTMSIGIPLSLYLLRSGAGRARLLFGLYPVLAVVAVLLTASRGGFISCIIASSSMILLPRGSVGGRIVMLLMMCAIAVCVMVLIPQQSLDRLGTIQQEMESGTLSLRTVIWRAAIEAWQMQPVFGSGAGSFAVAISPIIGEEWVAHNAYLGVLVDSGVIGFTLFGGALIACLICALRMPRQARPYWIVTILTWAVGVSALSWEYHKVTWLILALSASHGAELTQSARQAWPHQSRRLLRPFSDPSPTLAQRA